MSAATTIEDQKDAQHQEYVQRLRGQLAKPKISVTEARDGMLDCFVSTYHEGVKSGLKGILGIDAGPNDVARAATGMFRSRLRKHAASFEQPTVDALSAIKQEVDEEMHFVALPAEISATHDQVCSILLSKAEGTLGHTGDRTSVGVPESSQQPVSSQQPGPAQQTVAKPNVTPPTGVGLALRTALSKYLGEIQKDAVAGVGADELEVCLKRAERLLDAVREFEDVAG